MTTPQPNPTDDLEAVARIIEDRLRFVLDSGPEEAVEIDNAREVAAAILALRPAGVGEAVQERIDNEWRALFGDTPDSFANPGTIHYDEFKSAALAIATPAHPDAALMERVRTVLGRVAKLTVEGEDPTTDPVFAKYPQISGLVSEARALLSDLKAEAGR